jgi:hypothetical protein
MSVAIAAIVIWIPAIGEHVSKLISQKLNAWLFEAHPVPLVVVLPKNLQELPGSTAGFKEQINRKLGRRGPFPVVEAGEKYPVAELVLQFDVARVPNGLNTTVRLSSASNGIFGTIASNSALIPTDLVQIAGPHIVDGLLSSLHINWNTLEATKLPDRCYPTTMALLLTAQELYDTADALGVMQRAIEIDVHNNTLVKDRCATAFWYLAQLLDAKGEHEQAVAMEKRANEIERRGYPRINPNIDPTEALARALAAASWKELEPGLHLLKTVQANFNIEFYAWQFDLSRYKFKIVEQTAEDGETAFSFRNRLPGAIFAVNAGRFDWPDGRHTVAVGLVLVDGETHHEAWTVNRGGVLAIWDNAVRIIPTKEYLGQRLLDMPFAVQGTPVMIDPGGMWSMVTNDHDRQSRVAVCLPKTGDQIIVVVVAGNGLSLWELASVLKPGNPGKMLNCDSAISLDGGPGTQVSFDSSEKIELAGSWGVHDALVAFKRPARENTTSSLPPRAQ